MNNLVAVSDKVPAVLRNQNVADLSSDLTEGAGGGFSVVSIRGGRFRIKQGGTEEVVTNADGDPVGSLEVVLVKAHAALSKNYYAKQYEEGDDNDPDCSSASGVAPDPGVRDPQAKTCAACPHNVWGSKMTPAGKKTKACSDFRRVAIIPAADAETDPMLLRIPAASLAELASYGRKLSEKGIPYNAVVTRLGFDTETAYPKLTYKPARLVDDAQAAEIARHLQSDVVERILNASDVSAGASDAAATPEPTPEPEDDFQRIADEMASKGNGAAAPTVPAETPAPAATAAAPVAPQETVEPEVAASDDDLDALLDAI